MRHFLDIYIYVFIKKHDAFNGLFTYMKHFFLLRNIINRDLSLDALKKVVVEYARSNG